MTEEEAQNKALLDDLAAAQPSWLQDGKGLRGDSIPIVHDSPDYSFPTPILEFSESASEDPMLHEEAPETGSGGDGEIFEHPFRCLIRQNPDTEVWEYRVVKGDVFNDLKAVAVTNPVIPTGWSVISGAVVGYLTTSYNTGSGEPTSCSLNLSSSPPSDIVTYDSNNKQTTSNKLLFRILVDGSGYRAEQVVLTNLVQMNIVHNGKPAKFPMPI